MTSTVASSTARPPWWRDIRVLRVVIQLVATAAIGLIMYVLWFNLTNNMKRIGIELGFDFLQQPVGVSVTGSDISAGSTVWRALVVGIKNTFALVVVGLPLLTIIGVLVGVARLSTNWLVAKAATIYVETLRNIPPLLIILFAFFVGILPLPNIQDPVEIFDLAIVNNRFIAVTGFAANPGLTTFMWVMVGALVVAAIVWRWRTAIFDTTGMPHHRVLWSLGVLLGLGVVGFLVIGQPFELSKPVLDGRVLTGGFSGLGGYFAMLVALVLYTASHVAEIVRGSILAVPKGQTEAANALALSGFQRLRHVVLPQAMRIALPPTINQYLNYVKNTSLGIAVGYSEVTLIAFQAVGNGRPAPQMVLILMASYLLFSLVISAMVNFLNRRLQLVTQ
ncbi:MAG TPA: ABC transporter permease subunit [Acidimicrobiia bacterium]